MNLVRYLHLLGATVWIGGLIVVGATVPAVRRVSDDRAVLVAIARRFGLVSWIALAVLAVTGLIQAADYGWRALLQVKVSLVIVSALLAGWHSLRARAQSPAIRGMIQAAILLLALVILGLAVAL